MGAPLYKNVPDVGIMRFSIIFARTLLPHADPPTSETISWSAIVKETSSIALTSFFPCPNVHARFLAIKTSVLFGIGASHFTASHDADDLHRGFAIRPRFRAAGGKPAPGNRFGQVRRSAFDCRG